MIFEQIYLTNARTHNRYFHSESSGNEGVLHTPLSSRSQALPSDAI